MKSPVMDSCLYVEFVCMTQCTKFLEKFREKNMMANIRK